MEAPAIDHVDGVILLRALFANSRDASVVVDDRGTIRFAAPGVGALLGIEPSSSVGHSVFEYVHPADTEVAARLFESRLKFEGADPCTTIRVTNASGGWTEVDVTVSLLPDPLVGTCMLTMTGIGAVSHSEVRLRRLIVVAEYVNRLGVDLVAAENPKAVVERIEASLGEVALLTGADTAGLFVERRDGSAIEPIAEWTARVDDRVDDVVLTGATLRHLLDRHVIVDDVGAHDNGLCLAIGAPGERIGLLATPFESGLQRGTLVLTRRNTDSGWWESDSELVRGVGNLVARALRTTWSDELLTQTYRLGPVGFSIRTLDGALIDCNDRYLELYGITRDEAASTSLFDVLLPQYHELVRTMHDKFRAEQIDHFAVEVEVAHGDGSTIWVRANVVPMTVHGSVERFVLTAVEDITEMREHRMALEHAASHDALTGVANRATLQATIEREWAATDVLPGLMLIDLDGFKQVNDRLGHVAGDLVLQAVAARLAGTIRRSDLVARLGGDEFAIVLPGLKREHVDKIATRLRQAVEQPIELETGTMSQTMSVGISIGSSCTDIADLMAKADRALYAAKHAGRRCHRVFDEPTRDSGR